MDKGKNEAMVTKFSEKFAIIMLEKHRKICRRGLTHLDATPIFKKSFRYLWATLYVDIVLVLKFSRRNRKLDRFFPKVNTSNFFNASQQKLGLFKKQI